MKGRTLLVLTLLVAGLGAFIWFVERDLPSSEEREERATLLLALEQDEVDALVLEGSGMERVRLEREPAAEEGAEADGGAEEEPADDAPDEATPDEADLFPTESGWRIVAPVEDRADSAAVSRLLSSVMSLRKQRTLTLDGVEVSRAGLGLDAPRATLVLEHGGKRTVLQVGAQLPASDSTVVAFEGDDEAHVVPGYFVADLLRGAEEWRHREPDPEANLPAFEPATKPPAALPEDDMP